MRRPTSSSTSACSACGWSRRPSTRTTRPSTTCSTPTTRAPRAPTSRSSSTRARVAAAAGDGHGPPHRVARRLGRRDRLLGAAAVRARRRRRSARGASGLLFADPEGLAHELVVATVPTRRWSPTRPTSRASIALQGFDGVRAYASDPERSSALLRETLGFTRRRGRRAGRFAASSAAAATSTTPPPGDASRPRRRHRPPRRVRDAASRSTRPGSSAWRAQALGRRR